MKKIVMGMLVVGFMAMGTQAAVVDVTLNEPTSGNWELYVEITGTDTAGLSGYAVRVLDTAGCSWAPVLESILAMDYMSMLGMTNPNAGYPTGTDFIFGNFQLFGANAIQGIGMVVVDINSPPGPPPQNLHYDVPALLGTLTTPEGLLAGDFALDGAVPIGLLNNVNEGYVPVGEMTVTLDVNPIPEPITLSLLVLGAGGLSVIRRIRRRRS